MVDVINHMAVQFQYDRSHRFNRTYRAIGAYRAYRADRRGHNWPDRPHWRGWYWQQHLRL